MTVRKTKQKKFVSYTFDENTFYAKCVWGGWGVCVCLFFLRKWATRNAGRILSILHQCILMGGMWYVRLNFFFLGLRQLHLNLYTHCGRFKKHVIRAVWIPSTMSQSNPMEGTSGIGFHLQLEIFGHSFHGGRRGKGSAEFSWIANFNLECLRGVRKYLIYWHHNAMLLYTCMNRPLIVIKSKEAHKIFDNYFLQLDNRFQLDSLVNIDIMAFK